MPPTKRVIVVDVMMSRVLLRVGGGGGGCGTTNILCAKRGGGIKEGNRGWIALFHLTLSRERERVNISIASVEYIERGAHHSVATYLISDISLIYVILARGSWVRRRR